MKRTFEYKTEKSYNVDMEHELTLAQKIKIFGTMSLVALAVVVGTAGTVVYQRNAKVQAAELAKTQLANVEAMKTSFPRYVETKEFKNLQENTMVKIPFASLPTTFTPDNITPAPSGTQYVTGWSITKGGTAIADDSTPNGWSIAEDFAISAPALPDGTYGTYDVNYSLDDHADPGFLTISTAQFKIVPPCPTSVTLTCD